MAYRKPKPWANKPPPGTPVDGGSSLSQYLLRAWALNEGAGTKAQESVKRVPGVLSGTTVATWGYGGVMFASASGQYIKTGTTAVGNGQNRVSIAARVRPDSTGAARIIYAESISVGVVFGLYQNASNKFEAYVFNGSDNQCIGATTITAGRVYDVVATFDVPSHTIKLYVNGVLDATLTTWSGAYTSSGSITDASIGRSLNGGGGLYFNGLIQHVYLFASVLRLDQVVELRALPYNIYTPPRQRMRSSQSGTTATIAWTEADDVTAIDVSASSTATVAWAEDDDGCAIDVALSTTTHRAPLSPFRSYTAKINGTLVTGTYEQIQALIESIAQAEAEKAAQEAIKEAKKPRRAPFLRIMPGKPIEPHIGKKVDNPLVARPLVQEYEAAYQRFLSAMIEQAIARQLADEIDDEETLLLLI